MAALPAKSITRSFQSLSAAVAEAIDARVFAGIQKALPFAFSLLP
jgi:hypothetical protein